MTEKIAALKEKMATLQREGFVLAFSGGVDSSLLLKLASFADLDPVQAVMFSTRLHPKSDAQVARRVAAECGAALTILEIDELQCSSILNNPTNRCYLCKQYLFQQLKQWAAAHGLPNIVDGTNADDLLVYRPGIRALRELGIQSPLAELGFSKAEVRQLAEACGLSVAARPSAPCMATRLPYGARLDWSVLERLEQGEQLLQEMGYPVVRLRLHQNIIRIEIPSAQFPQFLQECEGITHKLKQLGFDYITLDLEGFRSGSMDLHIK